MVLLLKKERGTSMDYNVLRRLVANSVDQVPATKDNSDFKINMFVLAKKLKPLGLFPLVYKKNDWSKRVEPSDIPLLMEYFKGEKIQWFDGRKSFLSLVFLREEDLDDPLQELLQDLTFAMELEKEKMILPCGMKYVKGKKKEEKKFKCPELEEGKDIVSILASIVSTYPCYTAIVARWIKPESISLNIRFRANSVLLAEENNTSEDNTVDDETEDESSENGSE